MDSGDEALSGSGGDDDSDDARGLGGAETMRASEVTTLGQMIRMVPQLRRNIGTMPPEDLVEVFLAASRVRLYDATLFGDLLPELRARLRRRAVAFAVKGLIDILVALQELNAYDAVVFSAVAGALRNRVSEMDAGQRRRVIAVLKAVGHSGDEDFLGVLIQREKQEAEAQQSIRQAADYLVMRSPGQLRPCRF